MTPILLLIATYLVPILIFSYFYISVINKYGEKKTSISSGIINSLIVIIVSGVIMELMSFILAQTPIPEFVSQIVGILILFFFTKFMIERDQGSSAKAIAEKIVVRYIVTLLVLGIIFTVGLVGMFA